VCAGDVYFAGRVLLAIQKAQEPEAGTLIWLFCNVQAGYSRALVTRRAHFTGLIGALLTWLFCVVDVRYSRALVTRYHMSYIVRSTPSVSLN
jgi:hypothetical protein